MLTSALAMGYAAQWITEWYAYNENVKNSLGLDNSDRIAGFLYLGTRTEDPERSGSARIVRYCLGMAWSRTLTKVQSFFSLRTTLPSTFLSRITSNALKEFLQGIFGLNGHLYPILFYVIKNLCLGLIHPSRKNITILSSVNTGNLNVF